MKSQWQIIAVLAALAAGTAAQAAVVANFTDGFGNTSVDQYDGIPGGGWATSWGRTVGANVSFTKTQMLTANPMNNGGQYMRATVTGTSSVAASTAGYYGRKLSSGADGITTTSPYTVSFDFRAVNMPGTDNFYQLSSNANITQNLSTTSWALRATSDGAWVAVNGDKNGGIASGVVLTNVAFAVDTVYRITVNVDPAAQSWSVNITDGVNTGSANSLGFRTSAKDGGAALMFGAFVPAGGGSYTFDLDNVAVTAVPEAASMVPMLGGLTWALAGLRRAK